MTAWITDSFYVAFVFWTVVLVAVEHSSVLWCSTELFNYAMETWWLGSETLLWLVTTLWDRCLPHFPYSKVMSTYKSVMSTSEVMSICGGDRDVLVLKCTVLNVRYCVVLFALWMCVLNLNNLLHICVCAMHVYHICVTKTYVIASYIFIPVLNTETCCCGSEDRWLSDTLNSSILHMCDFLTAIGMNVILL